MDKKKSLDLIKLEVLGCLTENDKENLRAMKEEGQEFPWKELGDYQNLIAILPLALELKYPANDLKDKTATMLYEIRDQIKAKIDAKKALEMHTESEVEVAQVEDEIKIEEPVEQNITTEEIEIVENELVEAEEGINLQAVHSTSGMDEPVRFVGNFKGKSDTDSSSLKTEDVEIKEPEFRDSVKTVIDKDAIEKVAREYFKGNLERELNSIKSTMKKNNILSFILFAVAIILMIAMYFIK